MFTKKNHTPHFGGFRCVSEDMIISEGIQAIRALRRGETHFIPYITRKGWEEEMMYSVPDYKYEVTTHALEGKSNMISVTVRRRRWLEEHQAKKNPAPSMHVPARFAPQMTSSARVGNLPKPPASTESIVNLCTNDHP